MIYCCGCYHQPNDKLILLDNESFEDRKIEILNHCPKCGRKKAVFSQRRIKDGKLITKISKKGKTEAFIEKYSKEPWEDGLKQPKNGSLNDMNWYYAIGMLNNKPDNKIRDFNDVEKGIIDTKVVIIQNTPYF